MNDAPEIPECWAAVRWEARFADTKLTVSRQWGRNAQLEVNWSLTQKTAYSSDTIVEGEFRSTGTLYDDLQRARTAAFESLEERARESLAIAQRCKP